MIANAPALLRTMQRAREEDEGPDEDHDSHCKVCHGSKNLIMCSTCPSVYHKACLVNPPSGPSRGRAQQQWKCKDCIEFAAQHETDEWGAEGGDSPMLGASSRSPSPMPEESEDAEDKEWWESVLEDFDGDVDGECSFVYRYISRESCSRFDSLPLTSLTISQRSRTPANFACSSTSRRAATRWERSSSSFRNRSQRST
jgi:hypothetical protein